MLCFGPFRQKDIKLSKFKCLAQMLALEEETFCTTGIYESALLVQMLPNMKQSQALHWLNIRIQIVLNELYALQLHHKLPENSQNAYKLPCLGRLSVTGLKYEL